MSAFGYMENILNKDRNSKELFFHILKEIGSVNVDKNVLAKYRAASILREYTHRHTGFYPNRRWLC
jgi:hypothetical protein